MTIAFGISRPPLREALKALTIMGVLESRQGGRYTVTDLSPSRLVAPFNVMLRSADYDVNEHFEARGTVELHAGAAVHRSAPRPEQRQRILKLAVDGRAFHRRSRRLPPARHRISSSRSMAVRATACSAPWRRVLYDVGLDVRRVASTVPGIIEKSVRQHVEVAEAIAARDAEGGRRRLPPPSRTCPRHHLRPFESHSPRMTCQTRSPFA